MPFRLVVSSIFAFSTLLPLITAQTPPAPSTPAAEAPKPDAPKTEAPKPDAPKPEPPKVRPFQELIKDAEKLAGLFTVYRTEDRTLLELAPSQLGRTYMLSLTCETGIGERGIYASQMCGETPVEFKKVGRRI